MNIENIKVITETLATCRSNYTVVSFTVEGKKWFATIEKTNIDENNCIKSAINGIQMLMKETFEDAVDARIKQDEIMQRVENGMDFMDAMKEVYKIA